ncbi:hypothetical protein BKA69DRAFT_1125395 [Paraphysoderma sedebokerense]|nr:hypothetical protein BKA69DRAFT_1125395 [Paraphysoderma sedebokerense]
MYAFDGDFKRQRNINLGGASARRENTLEKAKQERLQRERERLEMASATKIQNFYRSKQQLLETKNLLRSTFDSLLSQSNPPLPNSNYPLPTELIQYTSLLHSLLQHFSIFYNPHLEQDEARLTQLTLLLRKTIQIQNISIPVVFLPLMNTTTVQSAWQFHVSRLLIAVINKVVALLQTENKGKQSTVDSMDGVVNGVSVLDRCRESVEFILIVVGGIPTTNATGEVKTVVQKPLQNVLRNILNNGILASIRKAVLSFSVDQKAHPIISLLVDLSIQLSSHVDLSSELLSQFTLEILSIPLLPNRVSVSSVAKLSSSLAFDEIIKNVYFNMRFENGVIVIRRDAKYNVVTGSLRWKEGSASVVDPETCAFLLSNVVAFGRGRAAKMSDESLMYYASVLNLLMSSIPPSAFVDEAETDITQIEDDEDDELEGSNQNNMEIDTVPPIILDSRLKKWISYMYESPHLKDLLRLVTSSAVLPPPPAPSATTLSPFSSNITSSSFGAGFGSFGSASAPTFGFGSAPITASATPPAPSPFSSIQVLSLFLATLINVIPTSKTPVLNTLLVWNASAGNQKAQNGLLRILWHNIERSNAWKKWRQTNPNPGMPVESVLGQTNYQDYPVITLFLELYSRYLFTIGDDEFFQEAVFSMHDVAEISAVLKNVAFCLLWNESTIGSVQTVPGTTLKIHYLAHLVAGFLQQIHARDSRKRFVSVDHWYIPFDIDVDILTQHSISSSETSTFSPSHPTASPFSFSSTSQASSSMIDTYIHPRLSILRHIPFTIPFSTRISIFRSFILSDKIENQITPDNFHSLIPVAKINVRRSHIFEDAFDQLWSLGSKIKERIAITFIDKQGMVEAGIDGGGVYKEFLMALVKQTFNVNYGLFKSTKDNLMYPNPSSFAKSELQLKYFEFLGRIIGKAIYDNILLEVPLAPFFLNKWLGKQNYVDDLPSLDEDLYRGLMFLKNYDGNVEDDLSLTYTVKLGNQKTVELIPNGSSTPVTAQNRLRYIYLMAHYRLNTSIRSQSIAFFQGLSSIIPSHYFHMFSSPELSILLSGASVPIDLSDLRKHTNYSGGFYDTHPVIVTFWKVLNQFEERDKKLFLKFVTSVERPPLGGFNELEPKFGIRAVVDGDYDDGLAMGRTGGAGERLPTASTCLNLLKLPMYKNEKAMREKLLYSIRAEAGFDLS